MDTVVKESAGYKRLNFADLNFADEKDVDKESIDDIFPIHWTKNVLLGGKKVIIKEH